VLGRAGLVAAVALAVAIAGPGCGGSRDDDSRDEAKRIRVAYTQLQTRFAAKDSEGVCARISKAAKEQVGSLGHARPTTCARDVRQLFKWIKPGGGASAQPKATNVAMDGDTATVTARLGDNASAPVRFVEEDGEWKLDSFFAITGPPAPDML
jgi:hypothetical protein